MHWLLRNIGQGRVPQLPAWEAHFPRTILGNLLQISWWKGCWRKFKLKSGLTQRTVFSQTPDLYFSKLSVFPFFFFFLPWLLSCWQLDPSLLYALSTELQSVDKGSPRLPAPPTTLSLSFPSLVRPHATETTLIPIKPWEKKIAIRPVWPNGGKTRISWHSFSCSHKFPCCNARMHCRRIRLSGQNPCIIIFLCRLLVPR